MTDEEDYKIVKKAYKENPKIIMNPKKWKKLRIEEIRAERRNWVK